MMMDGNLETNTDYALWSLHLLQTTEEYISIIIEETLKSINVDDLLVIKRLLCWQ